jgi:putative ABC transport system permease protein
MRDIWRDVRYSVRLLFKSPGFTAAALLTLAVAIGANTAVFSIVYGTLLRPLPFVEPDNLALVWAIGRGRTGLPLPDLKTFERLTTSYDFASSQVSSFKMLETDGPPIRTNLQFVGRNFFELLGVAPGMGRAFQVDDERPNGPVIALISHGFWQRQFGGDPDVLGRAVRLQEYPPLTIIGVLPYGFRSPTGSGEPPEVWTLLGGAAPQPSIGSGTRTFIRLKPDVTLQHAQSELSAVQSQIIQSGTDRIKDATLQLERLSDFIVRSDRTTILIFAGAVLCVLLVGIVNLVGLEMARFPLIENELAIRASLGAPRSRLVQLMLVKSLVLGLTGGIIGCVLAAATNSALVVNLPAGFPRRTDIQIDGQVLAFSFALAIVSSILVAAVPAIRASRPNVRETINSATRSLTGSLKHRILQDTLTAVETAVALVLVVGAGLLIHSFWRLTRVDIGFNPEGLSTVRISLPASYQGPSKITFFTDILRRFQSLPNFESVSIAQDLPFDSTMSVLVTAADAPAGAPATGTIYNGISDEFFTTLDARILAGRTFSNSEIQSAARVGIVNESLAQALWPGLDPLGKQLKRRGDRPTIPDLTVVGLAADMRTAGLSESPGKTLYVPYTFLLAEFPGPSIIRDGAVIARTPVSPSEMRKIIETVEPDVSATPNTVNALIARDVARQRFQTIVLTSFAGVALLLAALGVYSVLSFAVSRRTREMGVRIALGAKPQHVFALVFRQAVAPAAIGLGAGLDISYALQRVLASYLYEIQPNDTPTYAVMTLTLAAVLLLACAIPARRATRLDPLVALRHE